jgi:hypothetical protein
LSRCWGRLNQRKYSYKNMSLKTVLMLLFLKGYIPK